MNELVFMVTQDADGGYSAEALGENIYTQGDTWQELRENAQDATRAFFFEGGGPKSLRLHLQRDEVLAVA